MKKNAFLTFIFACIPGAGQMYYGYMKRGTSLLVYFCLFIMLGAIISPLVVGVAVVYMFSFSCSRRTGRISSAVPKPK